MEVPTRHMIDGVCVETHFVREDIVRIRVFVPGRDCGDSGLNRYGFIVHPSTPDLEVEHSEDDSGWQSSTQKMNVVYSTDKKTLDIQRAGDDCPVLRQVGFSLNSSGSEVRFAAQPDEDWCGFGDQTRERLFHRGHKADCHVCNVQSYIPVPFFMSTNGGGVLVNTTHHIVFDMCATRDGEFFWRDQSGAIDYYVMVGSSYRELLDSYTDLTGKPKLPPRWAFGLWYICRDHANDYEAINDAWNFRREGIPCDVLGLEPGWMETRYDLSTEKKWDNGRFPIPFYAPNGPHNFINALKRMGYHFELWLCNEYDLSYEAERRIGRENMEGGLRGTSARHSEMEVDEHFSRKRFLDQYTKREEPWFEHLKKFVDQGVDFFKQDGAFQVMEHPDRIWGNGMTDGEMHNLYPLLYSRQMHEGFEEHTGRRAVVFTVAGWIGFQAWCGTWTGDTGGGLGTLGAMLNTSMVGHAWATNDMEVSELEGIHFGYLQPWSQINSWNYFRMPWLQGNSLAAAHKYYGQLRSRLIPYLYSWAWQSTRTGYPLMVPLALEFPSDRHCRDNLHQYLLGRDLMVVIYKKTAYFPEGRWMDFWTGEILEGGRHREISWPEDRGGGLFVRSGAIIPLGPEMQYRGEKPVDPIELYVFPEDGKSSLVFYEDDGVSLKHHEGDYATTRITAENDGECVSVKIDEPKGSFDGHLKRREWSFRIILPDMVPTSVTVDGEQLPTRRWSFDADQHKLTIDRLRSPGELILT
ncbi:MAG: DUF5110 domain-containing protein [Candidatus Pacebacteria bacterium]|nr:DUF5110 domain-containing protein [Candidatus Paceibacterota bacterium]